VPTKLPKKKTPNLVLPWLREVLGLTQHQLANMIGASQPTIQAAELGRLPLSERFAWAISQKIGIDARWLLAGKLPNPPPDPQLIRQRYEEAQKGDLAGLYFLVFRSANNYTYAHAAFFRRFFGFVHPGEISSSR
jgi:transcriptional regulator with XRE-family HTH domain